MSLLDQAVGAIESWGPNRKKDRARCLKLFKQVVAHMKSAIAVWEKCLKKAPESGDRYTAVMWMGAGPARKLQAIHLENNTTAIELSRLTGVRFKDSLSLADDLDIVQPYDELGPDESGNDRARSAIQTMTTRKERVEAAIAVLEK